MRHAFRIAALVLTTTVMLLLPVPAAKSAFATSSSASAISAATAMADESIRATLKGIVGSSGNLRALIGMPTALANNLTLTSLLSGVPFGKPGVHSLGMSAPDGDSLVVVSMESFAAMQGANVGGYYFGSWPKRGRSIGNPQYDRPTGFIGVTRENSSTLVSKRFRLGDFLTHDQKNVWPKVLVLRPELLDKLELVGDRLERAGMPSSLHVMSGFRTPQYNAQGVGAKGGRASESRHMFGDAADVFVDADGNGRMDDLNGDGKINIRDAQVLYAVAEGVELEHPSLVGGLSAYAANSAHGPFVHIDARGKRARW